MTNLTPTPDIDRLQPADPSTKAGPARTRTGGERFHLTVRAEAPTAAMTPDTGGRPSAADVIRAVWKGDVRADQYELLIVRAEDAHDLNGS